MSLIFNVPVELAAELLGKWLIVPDVCTLEVACASSQLHQSLMEVYETTVMTCRHYKCHKNTFEKQVEWMVARKIRVSSLQIHLAIPNSGLKDLTSILANSKSFVKRFEITANFEGLDELICAVAEHCQKLTFIEVCDCTLPGSFRQLLTSAQNLKELAINFCAGLHSSYFDGLACPLVRILRAHGKCERDVQIALLRMCSQVTLYDTYGSLTADLSCVPPTLEKLLVVDCNSVGTMQLSRGLLSLTLKNCHLADESIARVCVQCPNLTEINISGNDSITTRSMKLIGSKYSHILTSLNVRNCLSLSQESLIGVCAKCTSLRTLDISENPHFTVSVCEDVLNIAPYLRHLWIHSMTVSDAALQRIAVSQLETLRMYGADGYTEVGIAALMEGCASMKVIYIMDERINSLVTLLWSHRCPGLEIHT